MRPDRLRGKFITFEGGEGSGKSVQASLLAKRLDSAGVSVTLTREPGGSPGAEEIRDILLTGEADRWTPLGEALLFSAARADHLAKIIRPGLAAGELVLCDRFADSTRAYQGVAQGVPADVIETLNTLVLSGTIPDLTLILDVDVATGLARAKSRGGETRYERFGPEFHEKLRAAYRLIAGREPERCRLIDGARGKDEVAETVWSLVVQRFDL